MKKTFKILVLLYNNFSNDSRVLKECSSLVRAGHDVELWAFYDPKLPEEETINGFLVRRKLLIGKSKIHAIKKSLKRKVEKTALHIEKAAQKNPFFLKKLESVVRRFLGFFIRLLLAKIRVRKAIYFNAGKISDFQVVHCNDLQPLELGVEFKKKNPHLKIVYDSHEFQTEIPSYNEFSLAKSYAQNLERKCIKYASEVISVSPDIANEYEKIYDLKHVHLIMNCPLRLENRPERSTYFRDYFGIKNGLVFLYQGALKGSRGVGEILDAFSLLWEKGFKSHHIVFMGYGSYENEIINRSKKFSNIHFHPSVGMYELPKISNSADYGIIFTPDTCKNHTYSLPNKLFEYIAFGLPVIVSPLQTMKKMVEEDKIGFVTKGYAPQDLCDKVSEISMPAEDEMRDLLWKLHSEKYNWDIEEKKLVSIYDKL